MARCRASSVRIEKQCCVGRSVCVGRTLRIRRGWSSMRLRSMALGRPLAVVKASEAEFYGKLPLGSGVPLPVQAVSPWLPDSPSPVLMILKMQGINYWSPLQQRRCLRHAWIGAQVHRVSPCNLYLSRRRPPLPSLVSAPLCLAQTMQRPFGRTSRMVSHPSSKSQKIDGILHYSLMKIRQFPIRRTPRSVDSFRTSSLTRSGFASLRASPARSIPFSSWPFTPYMRR